MAKYRKYSKEFQLQAAKLVTEQGYSYDKAAERLGTTGFSIRNWVKKFQQTGELPSKADCTSSFSLRIVLLTNLRLGRFLRIVKPSSVYRR